MRLCSARGLLGIPLSRNKCAKTVRNRTMLVPPPPEPPTTFTAAVGTPCAEALPVTGRAFVFECCASNCEHSHGCPRSLCEAGKAQEPARTPPRTSLMRPKRP